MFLHLITIDEIYEMTVKRSTVVVATLILTSIFLAGCEDAGKGAAVKAPLTAVTTMPALMKELQDKTSFVARVHAIDTFDVRTRVEGFIESKNFIDGAPVKAGDVLFEIEQESYQNEIDLIKAEVRGAQASQKEAQLNLKRGQELITRGNISQAKLDEFEATVAKATADIDRLTASLRQAELQLSYTKIVTPITGRIGKTEISIGNLVKPSSELLAQVISFDPIYVSIAVSEKDLLEARRNGFRRDEGGVAARLRLSDGQDYSHEGIIDFVDNKVDPTTDTITIRATFPNPDQILFPNQYVAMMIARKEVKKMLVVPQVAIQENQGGQFVLTVDKENRIAIRNIKLGREEGEYIVVEQGLEVGESVVVQGIQKVRPGQEVAVTAISDINSEGE